MSIQIVKKEVSEDSGTLPTARKVVAIGDDLHKQLKSRAAGEGRSLQELAEEYLRVGLNKEVLEVAK